MLGLGSSIVNASVLDSAYVNTHSFRLGFNGAFVNSINTNTNFENVFNSSFSISFWIKPSSLSDNHTKIIFGVEDSTSADQCYLGALSNGMAIFFYAANNDATAAFTNDIMYDEDTWTHVVWNVISESGGDTVLQCYKNKSEISIAYLGGSRTSFSNHQAFDLANDRPLEIGGSNDDGTIDSQVVNTLIDEFAIFSTPLSSAQIEAAYNREDLTGQDGLVAYYQFNNPPDGIVSSLSATVGNDISHNTLGSGFASSYFDTDVPS
tara:strand:- start:1247 stop:2038 length:792 start_codon:yes stop_codon:yes gene_type:complete